MERRKRNRRTWTREDWGNHLADKGAGGIRQLVTTKLTHVQWSAVNAITAISSLPEEGELYIGDYRGHPNALHGIMDAVHTVHLERYTVNRDTTSGAGYYWLDNTISLAAVIFNGHSNSIGHYAHTARMCTTSTGTIETELRTSTSPRKNGRPRHHVTYVEPRTHRRTPSEAVHTTT